MKIKQMVNRFVSFTKSPKAMMYYAIAGVFVTSICTGIATWKAKDIYEKEKVQEDEKNPKLKPITTMKIAACYVPAVASAAGSIIAIKKSSDGYERALTTMKDISKGQQEQIHRLKDIAAGAALKDIYPGFDKRPEDSDLINGEAYFCEEFSGNGEQRYFKSTMLEVKDAEVSLNRCLGKYKAVSLNYLYALLDIPLVPDGYERGWSWDWMIDNGYQTIDIDPFYHKDEDGKEYYILEFNVPPRAPLFTEDPNEFRDCPFDDYY